MELIESKRQQLLQALSQLDESILLFNQMDEKNKAFIGNLDYEKTYKAFRDSMIQRFEFSSELFWKYIKRYIESVADPVDFNSPSPVIRAALSIGILHEKEAESALKLIHDRNRTSHIYKEEIAQELIEKIPGYYQLMNVITRRLIYKNQKTL